MKTVNILTIHKEPNYGAVLQAYALYKTIEIMGHRPQMINLSMDFRTRTYSLKNRMLLPIYRWVKGYSHCFQIAKSFSKRHCPNQIGDFHTFEEMEKYQWNKEDYYLIGSDQVWNPQITSKLSSAYTLSFLGKEYKKYSYAASMGNIKDEEKRKKELDMVSLAQFKKIAVREKFAIDFLHRNGIEATEVLDPTLLLDDYHHLLPRKVQPKDQILFLSLSDTSDMNSFVKKVANTLKLPIIKHYGYLQPQRKKNLQFLPIEEWLYAIASSKVVITDSFHATVFSILFNRPFFVYISSPSKVFRISNLLDNIGIKGRIVNDVAQVSDAPEIDYEQVKTKLSEYRKTSLNYLKEILK